MSEMNLVQALKSGLREAMRLDDDVMLMGEDIGGSAACFA